jgi:hypothetical protein
MCWFRSPQDGVQAKEKNKTWRGPFQHSQGLMPALPEGLDYATVRMEGASYGQSARVSIYGPTEAATSGAPAVRGDCRTGRATW